MIVTIGANLTTRHDFRFFVRPARPGDEEALTAFYDHVSKTDLRFRYLTAHKVSREEIAAMTHLDHRTTEDFIAFAGEEVVANATLAVDSSGASAEVAISVHEDYKALGIGWTLLDFIAKEAKARGIHRLRSIESRENHAAIELERDMGFTARPFEDDATLVVLERELA